MSSLATFKTLSKLKGKLSFYCHCSFHHSICSVAILICIALLDGLPKNCSFVLHKIIYSQQLNVQVALFFMFLAKLAFYAFR